MTRKTNSANFFYWKLHDSARRNTVWKRRTGARRDIILKTRAQLWNSASWSLYARNLSKLNKFVKLPLCFFCLWIAGKDYVHENHKMADSGDLWRSYLTQPHQQLRSRHTTTTSVGQVSAKRTILRYNSSYIFIVCCQHVACWSSMSINHLAYCALILLSTRPIVHHHIFYLDF